MPALGLSLFLIAVGAILAFAVTTAVEGVAIETIGWILMAVGAIGILFSLLFMMSFSPFARDHVHTERDHLA
jgi:Zn-dependent protease with chaperone function